MKMDSYGVEGKYTIRSQYFDSYADRDLRDNIDGVMEKRKIRTRIYPPDDQFVKLEYKCKSGSDSLKKSMSITREEALLMENHQYDFLLEHSEELAMQLYLKMMQGVYRPKTIVEYERTAFLMDFNDVRVTFDQNIRGTTNPYGIFSSDNSYTKLISDDIGVLEVKYNNFLPSPIKRIVEKVDRLEESTSKYSNARMAGLF